ncbi:MAG: PKD domain-containing protein, partial [Flammeovirgaceae bacterium]|nr:PKD domain-containing protein [Flammeovirgaceae bacterium]
MPAFTRSVRVGETVLWEGSFSGTPAAILWNLEGATPSTSTGEKTTVVYLNEGKYDVWLTALDEEGKANTIFKNDYIEVKPAIPSTLPSLVLASQTTLPGILEDASMDNEFIYAITSNANSFLIYRINNNGSITNIYQTTLPFVPKKIVVENRLAYILGNSRLAIFSFTNPSSPSLVDTFTNIGGNSFNDKTLAVSKEIVFLSNHRTLLLGRLLGNELNFLGSANIAQRQIQQVVVVNETTALLSDGKDVMTINFSNPSLPVIASSGTGFFPLQENIACLEISSDATVAFVGSNSLTSKMIYELNLLTGNIQRSQSIQNFLAEGASAVAHRSKSNSLLVAGSSSLVQLDASYASFNKTSPAGGLIRLNDNYALTKSNNLLLLYYLSGGANHQLNADFQASSTTIKAGRRVNFSNLSVGEITNYQWKFEGGTPQTSTISSPSITYNTVGNYTVTLKVSNANGYDVEKKVGYIQVIPPTPPVANFVADKTTIKVGQSVLFSDLSTNTPTAWEWTFAGGTPNTSTNQNILVSYANVGTYSVTLKASNLDGTDTHTKTNYITVVALIPPVANFTADVTEIEEGQQVQFTDLSENAPTSWSWTFAGGTPATSIQRNPAITYFTEGTYAVSLTATNADGSHTITRNAYIKVNKRPLVLPVANFSSNTQTVKVGNSVHFNDLSTNATAWNWSFSGGTPTTSTQRNPVITYHSQGSFDVSLTVTNKDGSNTKTSSNYITVLPLTPPVADFTANAQTVVTGQQVQFTDLSTNSPPSWLWEFQGGTPATSTQKNPVVQYTTVGVFAVKLTATNADGSHTITKNAFITVNEPLPQAPVANFTANRTTITENQTVQFSDLSTNQPTTWQWTFAGGTPPTSTQKNPLITYTSAGTYAVTLTVSNTGGSDTKTVIGYITVNPYIPQPPVANFSTSKTTIEVGQTIFFTDLSTNTPTSWLWEFQGGTPATSTQKNPSVQYLSEGVFNVKLTASNADGSDVEEKLGYITVTPRIPRPPVADFNSNTRTVSVGQSVNFFDRSTNGATSWSWSFSGGIPSTSTSQNPIVAYPNIGTYDVRLTASNADGSHTVERIGYITVTPYVPKPPTVEFFANKTIAFEGDEVQFFDRSSGNPTSWNWTFVGATPSTSSVQNPVVRYASVGKYTVRLTASNSDGSATKELVDYITILRKPMPPVADFTANKTTLYEGEFVTFTDLSTNHPDTWEWTFEGGSPATSLLKNPIVTYNKEG